MDFVVKYMQFNGYIDLDDGSRYRFWLAFENLDENVVEEKSFDVRITLRKTDNSMDFVAETEGKGTARKLNETTAEVMFSDNETDFVGTLSSPDGMFYLTSSQKNRGPQGKTTM